MVLSAELSVVLSQSHHSIITILPYPHHNPTVPSRHRVLSRSHHVSDADAVMTLFTKRKLYLAHRLNR